MNFYTLHILLPALLADVLVTTVFARKKQPKWIDKWAAVLVPSALYFIIAILWCFFYGGDPRFQGQGAIGLMVFLGLGAVFSASRLLLNLLLLGLLFVVRSNRK
ncbi:MAG: hypothetical protein AAFN12_01375 [Cyanobacteria bacterium J06560_2]